jgi:hypothetical protein
LKADQYANTPIDDILKATDILGKLPYWQFEEEKRLRAARGLAEQGKIPTNSEEMRFPYLVLCQVLILGLIV